jgi:hypothetical protein
MSTSVSVFRSSISNHGRSAQFGDLDVLLLGAETTANVHAIAVRIGARYVLASTNRRPSAAKACHAGPRRIR